jgi:hypothetical protein
VGTKRTNRADLATSVTGVDRKWLVDGQAGAIDHKRRRSSFGETKTDGDDEHPKKAPAAE